MNLAAYVIFVFTCDITGLVVSLSVGSFCLWIFISR